MIRFYIQQAIYHLRENPVIAASVARRLFGRTDVSGQHVELNHVDFQVCGVVADVSMLATDAYAQVWIPYTAGNAEANSWGYNLLGLLLSYAATFVLNGFLFCLLMNLLSAGIPAWRASRMNIVEAINGKR